MNSCAFHQMVILQAYRPSGCPPPLVTKSCNWESFYTHGREVKFPGSGTCDSKSNNVCRCEAGPAVFSINGDGFARAPRTIAYSDAKVGEANRCYGDSRDLTRDRKKNMCAAKPWRRILDSGEEWLKVAISKLPDAHFSLTGSDLVPGSRVGSIHGDSTSGTFATQNTQYSAPTFIPISSSRGSGDDSCAFDRCYQNTFNGPHVDPPENISEALIGELLGWFGAAADDSTFSISIDGPFESQKGQPTAFKVISGFEAEKITWNLGDGTVLSGSPVSHTYRTAGIYPVRVDLENPDGSSISAVSSARIGIPENQAPETSVRGNLAAQPGEEVHLDAASIDPDGRVARTFWNFGDGEFGQGQQTTHVWTEPGTYKVIFTATDDEGKHATTEFHVAVGTPTSPEVVTPVREGVGFIPAFTWKPIGGATSYEVRAISETDATSRQLTADASTACRRTSCTATFDARFETGDHFWSVSAVNEHGEGPPSEWVQFRVQTSRNNPPSVEIEAGGACGATCRIDFTAFAHDSDGDDLDFSWSGCENGNEASLTCFDDGPGFVDATLLVTDSGAATTSATASVPIFVASYSTGEWGECSATCGGGTQLRDVSPSILTTNPPGVDTPPAVRACNTQRCALTCSDYTNMYPRKFRCYEAGWRVCERRYRPDGIGGTIKCWKGFR
jgi:hypothetical protein